jgi:hypothetical protein
MKFNLNRSESRPFASKYKYKWQGWTAVAFGVIWVSSGEIALTILGVLLLAAGIFFLRGTEMSPKAIERSQKKADKLKSKIDEAKSSLASASGGKAVVAYRNLESLLKSTKAPDWSQQLDQILTEINFNRSSIQSDHIGTISGPGMLNRVPIEVYKNWIIVGQISYDVDVSTRGEVNVEGNVQIDSKGKKHDMRTASVNFVSTDWSHTFPFNLDQVTEARRIVAQLGAVTDAMKPKGVSSADIAMMIETIMNNSGQPPAEKLKQLSDLRFQRLLSDAEFDAAKARILGI